MRPKKSPIGNVNHSKKYLKETRQTPPEAALVREGFYLTYPHSNGFCKDGHTLVLGHLDGMIASLWKTAPEAKDDVRICEFDVSREAGQLWFDVASRANRLVVASGNEVWVYDLDKMGQGKCIYRVDLPVQMFYPHPSLSSDGRQVVIGVRFPERYAALWIDVESGESRNLFECPRWVNHLHFSPYDENWIGFCHEGACEKISDRVWGWHAVHAPEGRCLFDQNWGTPARKLYVGHERWCFHAPTALVVAYGGSPGGPRGVYEVSAEGKPPRLISQGDRHLHVNVSRSGHYAVIDTSGPHDLAGRGWENAQNVSDILLLDVSTGEQRWLARSKLDPKHPYHPHPVFSPDEKFIFFNEATLQPRGNRVRAVENPWFSELA